MCVQGCRTFLWGGAGTCISKGDEEYCVCDSSAWVTHNILGKSSCVPIKAHQAFGCAGVILSVASLLHSVYQLHIQLKFHAERMSFSTTPAERCRKQMHITAIINAVLALVYFLLVLYLDDDQLHLSFVVMLVLQTTVLICGFLTVRMWIYTNDRRLMQGNPRLLKISAFLEGASGQRICYTLLSGGPVIAIMLALTGRTETAVKLVGVAFVLLIMFADAVFWIFGTSLLRAIKTSLSNSQRSSDQTVRESVRASARAVVGGVDEESSFSGRGSVRISTKGGGRRGRSMSSVGESTDRGPSLLLAARKKVRWSMMFCAHMSLQGYALLIFSCSTAYGTAAPVVLFGLQMALIPLIWHVVQIQLHAGRSSRRSGGGSTSRKPFTKTFTKTITKAHTGRWSQKLAPVEADEEEAGEVATRTDADTSANPNIPC